MAEEPHLSPPNPFGDGLGLRVTEAAEGRARLKLAVTEAMFNPHRVVHGGVLFAMADNAMGAALYSSLGEGESCSTIELKINFLRPVSRGELICDTAVVHKGRSTAVLDATIREGEVLVAKAQGTFAILPRRGG